MSALRHRAIVNGRPPLDSNSPIPSPVLFKTFSSDNSSFFFPAATESYDAEGDMDFNTPASNSDDLGIVPEDSSPSAFVRSVDFNVMFLNTTYGPTDFDQYAPLTSPFAAAPLAPSTATAAAAAAAAASSLPASTTTSSSSSSSATPAPLHNHPVVAETAYQVQRRLNNNEASKRARAKRREREVCTSGMVSLHQCIV